MGKRGTNDIAPVMRAGFQAGLRLYARKKNMTIPQVFCHWLEEDWQAVLSNMARYAVREAKVTGSIQHDHKHSNERVSETASWLEDIIGEGACLEVEESLPTRPVLPVAVRVEETGH